MSMSYFHKYGLTSNGIEGEDVPKRKELSHTLYSGFVGFISIFIILLIEHHTDFILTAASFGASAVLLYDAVDAPFSQPRNVICGQIFSALCGVCCYKLFSLNDSQYFYTPVVGAVAVASSIIIMGLTQTTHPPGAATALIPVIGSKKIIDLGFMYVLHPIASGIFIMVFIAVVFNNIVSSRRYPKYWY